MVTNVFISYDHDDQNQVNGFKLLKSNPDHPLEFYNHSLHQAVKDRNGNPIKHPPSDPRSLPVREEIIKKFNRASKLVVLIGMNTHTSEWVNWEINAFYELKRPLSGDKTWKRIRGMMLKGADNATAPAALMNGRSTMWLSWDPETLDNWIELDPDT